MTPFPHDPSCDPRLHHEILVSEAARALRERRFAEAFVFSDQRCRAAPVAEAEHYLLRAAALNGLGEAERAYRDVRQAIAIEPENLLANRSLLHSSQSAERHRAAKILLHRDRRPAVLKEAIAALEEMQSDAFGAFEPALKAVHGWLAWRGNEPLILQLDWDCGSRLTQVRRDPTHPLSGTTLSAARWRLDWPQGAETLEILTDREPALLCDACLIRPQMPHALRRGPMKAQSADGGPSRRKVAVILPVYGDYDATRACLDALLADAPRDVSRSIIAVDDASPDGRISALIKAAAGAGSLRLLRHARNLGFARSVNHALDETTDEDVLLLNADTIVPPGFLDRLAHAAHGRRDVGTVTPFSNNGEYTSFPLPFRENDLPRNEEIVAIDRAAAQANAGRAIEMPNGTGFCLYITRACLSRVGALSQAFGRGYGEDIDFCLRAAQAGFRNVCAANVFVGHAGTRSFGPDKRALVVRNLGTIAERFPGYRATSAAFMAADPLRTAREALQSALGANAIPFRAGPTSRVTTTLAADRRPLLRHA